MQDSVHVGIHIRKYPQGPHFTPTLETYACGKNLALFIACCQQHVAPKCRPIHRKPYVNPPARVTYVSAVTQAHLYLLEGQTDF